MKNLSISVAIATYNGEKYIREQIDSILKNVSEKCTYELVVSDDGSKDATLDILQSYQESGIPLKILKGPGMGIKQNIANAIAACTGEYIFLADQDDVWTENKVDVVMQYLGKDGCQLVNHDAKVMNGNLTKVLKPSFFEYRGSKSGFLANLWKNRYMGCCMAFDAALKDNILPVPNQIEMHDQWIGMINDLRKGKSRFIKEPLLLYRRHEENVSDFGHGTIPEMLKKRFILLAELFKARKIWKK